MTDFALKALEYGVLGLCAITLILVWRMLRAEQGREGPPRPGVLRSAYVFMGFCLLLAILNGFVQLRESEVPEGAQAEIGTLAGDVRTCEDKLLAIRSAAHPILSARVSIIDRLDPGPERDTLKILVESLREALQ